MHHVWKSAIWATLQLIEKITNNPDGVCAFNLAFDWFHFCQTYTTLKLLAEKVGDDEWPEDHIEQYAICEERARFSNICLKPVKAFDLMLHARKGPYQSTMGRDSIKIRRVPTPLAEKLAVELQERIPLNDIYFAGFKNKERRKKQWVVYDIKDEDDEIIPDFKNVVLKFMASSALKALIQDALKIDTEKIKVFADIDLPRGAYPVELGYAPYALSVGKPGKWNGAWPDVIATHIEHWAINSKAKEYAEDDVRYLQLLDAHFNYPSRDDNDSVLAAMVGAVRWRGFAIDKEGLKEQKIEAQKVIDELSYNHNSHRVVRLYLEQVLSPTEAAVLKDPKGKISTKGIILEEISKWEIEDVCDDCLSFGCEKCDDGLIKTGVKHPAAIRAAEVLKARRASKRIQLINKFLLAGRFHASFRVIGALSSRMSGADGLNPQGINHDKKFRSRFPLADGIMVLCGGDFSGFEICLMDAAYGDPVLRQKLVAKRPCHICDGEIKSDCRECEGTGLTDTKIHALFGEYLFPPMTYGEILATKGLPGELDKYDRSKKGVYATAYGGEAYTLQTRVGVSQEAAEDAFKRWCDDHKVWGRERKKIFDMFCSMRQPGGLGTKVYWHEPADYIESMFGFKRYFTLENSICKVLFNLAEEPPKDWKDLKIKVIRRDRVQSACGALRSALFGSAFQIQAANMRAAGNHVIQSSGATTTKKLQRQIWDHQPVGIVDWKVQPMNVHDEVMVPTHPTYINRVKKTVDDFMVELKKSVPLAEIEWESHLKSWADK